MTSPLTDTALTQDGLAPDAPGQVLVIACGALAHEILAIKALNGLDHVTLTCLPAILHNTPDAIPDAVEQAVLTHRDTYENIFIAYADCGTGGQLATLCDRLGVEMIEGPHCYSFFEGNEAFAEKGEVTCFYLTDFLCRQFDAFVWRPLGLDKHPELRDMYFGNYTTLVYQSQIENPDLVALAKTHATRLGLAFEHRHTGYGDLATAIKSL